MQQSRATTWGGEGRRPPGAVSMPRLLRKGQDGQVSRVSYEASQRKWRFPLAYWDGGLREGGNPEIIEVDGFRGPFLGVLSMQAQKPCREGPVSCIKII